MYGLLCCRKYVNAIIRKYRNTATRKFAELTEYKQAP